MCPSPRPLIFPNGTPHAATIGPTASEVLSPTPPVECLSTTRLPSALAEIDRLAGADHRVGQRVRLLPVEPAEVHGHAPGGQLVVGNLAAGVTEDELGDLVGRKLLAVPLALDQVGGGSRRFLRHEDGVLRRARAARKLRHSFGEVPMRIEEVMYAGSLRVGNVTALDDVV